MINLHIPEWKKIKSWYETEHEQTPQIKFRIDRIESLINEAESKEKDLAHFR